MSLPQISAPGVSSVIHITRGMEQWTTVDNSEPLALFHAKFWGKSMAVEEKEWLNTQPPASDKGGDLEGIDLDDDIIPGCYVLDLGIAGLPFAKIWIRAEYIRIFNHLQAYHDRPRMNNLAPAVVITGQSGIGKSLWVYYALRRCLAESKPAIWYYHGDCYLFIEEGVYLMPAKFEVKSFVWTFVDADESKEGVPNHLAYHGSRFFVIYTTSPPKERWSRLHKTMRVSLVVMNPWSRAEIIQAASTIPNRTFTNASINKIFDELGPIPRLCLDYQDNFGGLPTYKRDLTTTIEQTTISEIMDLYSSAQSLRMDTASDKIFLVRRANQDMTAFSHPIVTVMTPAIQSRLAIKFRSLQKDEQLCLYQQFSNAYCFNALAGILSESMS